MGLAALLAGPVAGGAYAVWARWNQPGIHRSAEQPLAPIAADSGEGGRATYTLALAMAGEGEDAALTWDLIRGAGHQLSEAQGVTAARRLAGLPGAPLAADRAQRDVDRAVARIAARNPGAVAGDLALAGIGFVQASAGDADLTAALDATPGLTRASESGQRVAWQVTRGDLDLGGVQVDAAARLHVVDGETAAALDGGPGAKIAADLPAGAADRTVVLAERASAAWRATLDGERLEPVSGGGWAQAFEAPAQGGRLVIWYHRPWALPAAQVAVLALAGLVALPTRRSVGAREDI
jgi:hypothetical protein